jgi:hypothetical protein
MAILLDARPQPPQLVVDDLPMPELPLLDALLPGRGQLQGLVWRDPHTLNTAAARRIRIVVDRRELVQTVSADNIDCVGLSQQKPFSSAAR